jgi:hypothetical protein
MSDLEQQRHPPEREPSTQVSHRACVRLLQNLVIHESEPGEAARFAFVMDREAHHGVFSHRTSYRPVVGDARDQIDWSPEWSRRGRAVPIYAAIRELGRRGTADLVDRTYVYARALVTRIGALPGAQVGTENQSGACALS